MKLIPRILPLACIASSAASPLAFAGDVLVVSSTGPFTTIQSAVDAASDFDTILVKPGTYGGDLAIAGRSLALIGDYSGVVAIGGETTIHSVDAGELLVLAGVAGQATSATGRALRTSSNAGDVRVQQCTFDGYSALEPGSAVSLGAGGNVVLVACTLSGGRATGLIAPAAGATALVSSATIVELVGCSILGGESNGNSFVYEGAPGGDGGDGVRLHAGQAFFRKSIVSGAAGGRGGMGHIPDIDPLGSTRPCGSGGPGGDGGHGVVVGTGAPAAAYIQGGTFSGGTGGVGGFAYTSWGCSHGATGADGLPTLVASGSATTIPGSARTLGGVTLARPTSGALLRATGAPGDRVFVTFEAVEDGAAIVIAQSPHVPAPSTRKLPGILIGTIPAEGTLQAVVPVALPTPGVPSGWLRARAKFVASDGAIFRSNEFVLVVVDASY